MMKVKDMIKRLQEFENYENADIILCDYDGDSFDIDYIVNDLSDDFDEYTMIFAIKKL